MFILFACHQPSVTPTVRTVAPTASIASAVLADPTLLLVTEIVPDVIPGALRLIEQQAADGGDIVVMHQPEPLNPWTNPPTRIYSLIHFDPSIGNGGYELLVYEVEDGEVPPYPLAASYLTSDFQMLSYGEIWKPSGCSGDTTELSDECRIKARWFVDDAFEAFAGALEERHKM